MPKPPHHTIFFDVGGTLLTAHPSIGAVYAEVASAYGIQADPEAVENAARGVFRERRSAEIRAGGIPHTTSLDLSRDWWRGVVRASFGPAADSPRFEAFYLDVFEEFAKASRYRPFPEAEEVIGELRSAGRRIGIISNWDLRLRSVLEGLGWDKLFDPILISGEQGVEKPDPRIFHRARELAGAGPEDRMLLIGDSEPDDRDGGERAGFEVSLVRRSRGIDLRAALAAAMEG